MSQKSQKEFTRQYVISGASEVVKGFCSRGSSSDYVRGNAEAVYGGSGFDEGPGIGGSSGQQSYRWLESNRGRFVGQLRNLKEGQARGWGTGRGGGDYEAI